MAHSLFSPQRLPSLAACLLLAAGIAAADDLPRFIVPGHEQAMKFRDGQGLVSPRDAMRGALPREFRAPTSSVDHRPIRRPSPFPMAGGKRLRS